MPTGWILRIKAWTPITQLNLAPSRELKGQVTVAKLDCEAHEQWCKQTWNLKGYPTIYAFAYGKKIAQYDLPEFKLSFLLRWTEKLMASDAYMGHTPAELDGDEAMDGFLLGEPSKAKVVGFFMDRSIPESLEFRDLCADKELQKKVVFAFTRDPELFERCASLRRRSSLWYPIVPDVVPYLV